MNKKTKQRLTKILIGYAVFTVIGFCLQFLVNFGAFNFAVVPEYFTYLFIRRGFDMSGWNKILPIGIFFGFLIKLGLSAGIGSIFSRRIFPND